LPGENNLTFQELAEALVEERSGERRPGITDQQVRLLVRLGRAYPGYVGQAELVGSVAGAGLDSVAELIAADLVSPVYIVGVDASVAITPRGIPMLARHLGLVTVDHFDHQRLSGAGADARHTQAEAKLWEHVRAMAESSKASESQLRLRIADAERRFFGQILTVSAVLVAAFALIVTGGQVVQEQSRLVSVPAMSLFFRSLAVMIPVAGAVVVLIVAAWVFSWVRPDRLYDKDRHAPELRPPMVDDP
jgi:hypothetical protein